MRSTDAGSTALDAAIITEQIALLSRKHFDLVSNVIVATFVAASFWRVFPVWIPASWLALFWIIILVRGALRHSFCSPARTFAQTRRRARVVIVAVFATACCWGVTAAVLPATADPAQRILIIFVLGGMMAGGIVTNATYLPALLAFLIPTILPAIVLLLAAGNAVSFEMGVLLATFATVLVVSGRNINATIVDSLRLRFEEERLVVKFRASEASMAEAQGLAHVGGLEFVADSDEFVCTAETYRILGVDPLTFQPTFDTLLARVQADDRARVGPVLAEFIRTGTSHDIDYRLAMDDGTIKYARSSGRKVEGAAGSPLRLFAVIQDVTEQRRAAEEFAYRDALLLAVTAGTEILLRAESIEIGMPEALRALGESMLVDRVNVVQECADLAIPVALRYNWQAPDLALRLDAESFVTRLAQPTILAEVRALLSEGKTVTGQLVPGDPMHEILERMESKSLLLVPIFVDRELWGNLAVEACRARRVWSGIEINTLKTFAGIVGSLIVKNQARLLLETSEERFRVLSTTAQDAIVTMDGTGRIRQWNRSAERILGYSAPEAVGKRVHELMVPAGLSARAGAGLEKFLTSGEGPLLGTMTEFTAVRKDGSEVVVEVSLAGAYLNDGWQAMAILRDVSLRKVADAKLEFANMLLQTEMEASPDGILVVDENQKIISVNRRFAAIWGTSQADLEPGEDSAVLAAGARLVRNPLAFAARVKHLYEHPDEDGDDEIDFIDGRCLDRRTAVLRTAAGGYLGRVWYFRDITDRKRAESLAIRMARYDVVTGLANRSVFVEALAHAIAGLTRGAKGFAVIYLDLDHFKDVNDTLGHPVGDQLLKAVALRLRSNMRSADVVARFGGDEFAVFVSDVGEPADAALLADKLLKAIAEPFFVAGNDIRTGASIGIDLYGPGSRDAETLLSHADVALYRAKSEGRGSYRFFTDAMDREVRTRVTLGTELRRAVSEGQLFLLYQPQVAVESGRIVGLEALVRWHHPERGVLGPNVFIPIAESTGIVVALGQWVLRQACRQGRWWLDAGLAPGRVSVNVSGLQFRKPLELEANIIAALAETGLPARFLEIELTETVLMEVSLEHSEALARLRKSGVTIAIDDFGTGYSSLGYLRRFPVDRIKIAQDFVRDVTTVPGQAAIAKATIGLARDLGIAIIAEGVETPEQLAALRSWGCSEVQGFYFARPLSVEDVTLAMRAGGLLRPRTLSTT